MTDGNINMSNNCSQPLFKGFSAESIPGASLGNRKIESLGVPELKRWLECRQGASLKGKKRDLVARVRLWINNGWDTKYLRPPDGHCEKVYSNTILAEYKQEVLQFLDNPPPENEFSNYIKEFPSLHDSDIYNYYMIKCDGSKSTAEKHRANGWKFYMSGKILQTEIHISNGSCALIKSTIEASFDKGAVTGQTNKRYDVIAVIEKRSGTILGGRCLCKAGKGGFCKHVAATIYSLKDFQDRGKDFLPRLKSKTSKGQVWHRPKILGNTCVPLSDCDFSAFNYERDKRQTNPKNKTDYSKFEACPEGDNCVSKEKIERLAWSLRAQGRAHQFVDILKCNNYEPVKKKSRPLLHADGICTDFTGSNITDSPPSDMTGQQCLVDPLLTYNITSDEHHYYMTNVNVRDHKESLIISKNTRGQATNPTWMHERKIRLTASKFKSIASRKKDDHTALLKNLTTSKNFKATHTDFGRAAEPIALSVYKRDMERLYQVNVDVQDIGLVVNPQYPYLGASPDGFVTIHTNPPKYGLAEVKTLSKYGHLTAKEAANMPDMYISLDANGKIRLDRKDERYYQIQGQLFVCGLDWCDLIVWSPQGKPAYERIWKDPALWSTMLVKLSDFYFTHLLPCLTAKSNVLSLAENKS